MATAAKKFVYRKAFKIIHWGNSFDSLLELKYAISIQDDYYFLRGRVLIYYHHGSIQPTGYISEGVRSYTPDFLIRSKQTGEAFLVEIKPRDAQHDPALELRRRVAEAYIKWKGYDWKFKVIFDDEIILSEEMLNLYEDCRKHTSKSGFKRWLHDLDNRYGRSAPTFFCKVPTNADVRFIMYGNHSEKSNKNWK